MALKLTVQNYRGIRAASCTFPSGLSLLVGANGAGKTTLLELPELFRHAFERGWRMAIQQHGGLFGAKHIAATADEPVKLVLERANLSWTMALLDSPERAIPAEVVAVAGELKGQRDPFGAFETEGVREKLLLANDARSVARFLVERGELEVDALAQVPEMRFYADVDAPRLRATGSQNSTDTSLSHAGDNVLAVLRNWKDKRATRRAHDFVIESLRSLFPNFFDLEFEVTSNVVDALVVSNEIDKPLPLKSAANGLIHALMALTAVASAPQGGLVSLDEPETALHPHAIRRLLEAIREWSDERDIDVLLSTHSPVVIDALHDEPERIFVFSPEKGGAPTVLTELRDKEFLTRFSVGEMYVQSVIGAQQPPKASTGE